MVLVNYIFIWAVMISFILLQVFLSIRKQKWLGLMLPALMFSITIFLCFAMLSKKLALGYSVENAIIFTAFFNIPTVVFLVIYLICSVVKKYQVKGKNI